jgi:hypothetical protein
VQLTVGVTAHVHPVPLKAVAVRPVGSVSVTVTVPALDPVPEFPTKMVYAPVPPRVTLPVWLFAIVKSGSKALTVVVRSAALSFDVFVSPPPATATVFVTLEAAPALTLTVSVKFG